MSTQSLDIPKLPNAPFTARHLDHIVLRAKNVQNMLDFYVGVLGAEPHELPSGGSTIGRFGGALSHLKIGTSLIDLQSYNSPIGRNIHAGGSGLADDHPIPTFDTHNGTLDHFAINMEPYDPKAVAAYLKEQGCPAFAEVDGRYGADGDGYSIYLKDPEGNVVELKMGD